MPLQKLGFTSTWRGPFSPVSNSVPGILSMRFKNTQIYTQKLCIIGNENLKTGALLMRISALHYVLR
jgi:hypothetical protein